PPALQRRRFGEREQIADDARRTRSVLLDLAQGGGGRGPEPARRDHQLGVPDDALQRALEFLREAGHELADMSELLVLADLGAGRGELLPKLRLRPPPPQVADDQQRDQGHRHRDSYSVHRPSSFAARPSILSFSRWARTFSRAAGISAGARPS